MFFWLRFCRVFGFEATNPICVYRAEGRHWDKGDISGVTRGYKGICGFRGTSIDKIYICIYIYR